MTSKGNLNIIHELLSWIPHPTFWAGGPPEVIYIYIYIYMPISWGIPIPLSTTVPVVSNFLYIEQNSLHMSA
jgi:hypothetical protein